jgi:hypothetical protein
VVSVGDAWPTPVTRRYERPVSGGAGNVAKSG